MIYIFLSVCCSVFVSVLLKLAKRYKIDAFQAISWNYPLAALLTYLFFEPDIPSYNGAIYPIYIGLGILLPSLFVVLALSIRYTGIVKTDIAQRLSLFIPVIAAFLVFNESPTVIKLSGIGLAFLAIVLSIPWQNNGENSRSYWVYPLIVFIGMGIIDILFKQIAKIEQIPFTSSLFIVFILAFGTSSLYLIYLVIFKDVKPAAINILCGLILGIGNFGNIFFYIRAHQTLANEPSLVFSSMNIGVILLGSAVGVIVFREQLSRLNYVGIILALISIVVLTLA